MGQKNKNILKEDNSYTYYDVLKILKIKIKKNIKKV